MNQLLLNHVFEAAKTVSPFVGSKLSTSLEYLCEHCEERIYDVSNPSFTLLKLRDSLISLGKILTEDTSDSIYVILQAENRTSPKSCLMGLQLSNNILHVISVGKEGLIKQNLSHKAFRMLEDALNPYGIKRQSPEPS